MTLVAGRLLRSHARALSLSASLAAAPSVKEVGRKQKFKFLTAWFCPYAHRCALALEHHRGFIDWESVEALGWESRPSRIGENQRDDEHYYHWKSPDLLKYNPSGLVPTLIHLESDRAVFESCVTIEYVDEVARESGSTAPPLLPLDLVERARCRRWADVVNKTCCSPYYGVLVKADEAGRHESHTSLLRGIAAFCKELRGPFFSGAQPSLVDIALLPWAYRYTVLSHYKGPQYAVPRDGVYARFHAWLADMEKLPSVSRTLPDKQRYLEHVGKYATGSARSKVANAVRRGAQAHDIDDGVDG